MKIGRGSPALGSAAAAGDVTYPLAIKDDIQVVAVGGGGGGGGADGNSSSNNRISSLMSSARSHGRSANNRQTMRHGSSKIYGETQQDNGDGDDDDDGDGDRIEENGRRLNGCTTNGFYAGDGNGQGDRNGSSSSSSHARQQQQPQPIVQLESDEEDRLVEDEEDDKMEDLENLPLPPSPISKVWTKMDMESE